MVRIGRPLFVLAAAAVVLSACSGAATRTGTAASPRAVDLTMTEDMTFEPARIEVRRGETVAFRVRNGSNEAHEAYIGTEEEQRLHETDHSGFGGNQEAVTHMGYGMHIAPLGTGELVSMFDEDVEYVIGCHYPGHYAAGMRAVIDVSD